MKYLKVKCINIFKLWTFLLLLPLPVMAQEEENQRIVLETDSGDVTIMLYNETPLHRDNIVKLVKEGFYDGVLFHRVIEDFMIQTGDSISRHAPAGKLLGVGSYETYKIPAEIRFPQIFHKRGSVAAAREGDAENPQRESSMCQFYIVWGKRYSGNMMDDVEERIARNTGNLISFPQEVRDAYFQYGGTPHLDGQYTVFGEVVEGLDVVERIMAAQTDENNRPLIDIRIKRAYIDEKKP
ncbi:MAG: peptidylprolyl isomerase [Prevotella sp.]|nr:peptidylprolyl isomerase [Prevotella sp.]